MQTTKEKNQELTVKTVLDKFLNSHNLLDVLDTVRDAHETLYLNGLSEAENAMDKEDFLSIQAQNFDQNEIMNTVITFIANIVHLQTKNQ